MNESEILDSGFTTNEKWGLDKVVSWWEKKRILFNLLLFGTEILIMLYFSSATLNYGLGRAFIQTIVVNVIANGFYSMGWGGEVLIDHYFKGYVIGHGFRRFLLIAGIAFSVLLACEAYIVTLRYFS